MAVINRERGRMSGKMRRRVVINGVAVINEREGKRRTDYICSLFSDILLSFNSNFCNFFLISLDFSTCLSVVSNVV